LYGIPFYTEAAMRRLAAVLVAVVSIPVVCSAQSIEGTWRLADVRAEDGGEPEGFTAGVDRPSLTVGYYVIGSTLTYFPTASAGNPITNALLTGRREVTAAMREHEILSLESDRLVTRTVLDENGRALVLGYARVQ
jgi:hypothetical protein